MHTEGHKYHKTHFLLQILGLFASYDSVWSILMISVTQNDVSNVPGIADRLFGYYPVWVPFSVAY